MFPPSEVYHVRYTPDKAAKTLVTEFGNLVQDSMSICFEAVIEIRGVNPFVGVSSAQAEALKPGWRKPLPVLVSINGDSAIAWRTNMMPGGNGNFYLYLHGNMRKASGTKVGDRVRVEIEFDAAYRNGPQDPMPKWFRQALDGNARQRRIGVRSSQAVKKKYFATYQDWSPRTPASVIRPRPCPFFPVRTAGSWGAPGKTDHSRSVFPASLFTHKSG